MDNPWKQLPDNGPYVVPADAKNIEEHNKEILKLQYQTDVVPQPYIGSPSAPVYLLALNPGYCNRDIDPEQISNLAKVKRDTLMHNVDSAEYPFYPIDPEHRDTSTGEWWWKRLRKLAHDVGTKNLAKNIFCVEYISYHSSKYSKMKMGNTEDRLLSQQYSGHLVQQALNEGKEIVFMRSQKLWESLVDGLADYPNKHELNSNRSVYITSGNLKTYDRLVTILRQQRSQDSTTQA